MNQIIISGRIAKEIELKYTQSGKAVASFSVAVDDGWGDNKKTYFLNVVAWEKKAESCANHLDKGSKVLVQGKLTSRSYDANDGGKRYVTEIVANDVEFIGGNKPQEKTKELEDRLEDMGFEPVSESEELPF